MSEPKKDEEIINPRFASTLRMMQEFNQPYKTAVAINCSDIGDDNDYSCFLSGCIYELWKAGKPEMALTLANTDPMMSTPWTTEDLENRMIDHEKFLAEEKERFSSQWKFYITD